jgi:Leucine-rich repeat (LRR) protein
MTTQGGLRDTAVKFIDGVLTLINRRWTEVPPQMVETVKKLEGVKKINLAHNKLTSFPEWITDMTELEEIDIRNNQIKSLPDGLEKLTKLKVLQVSSNLLDKFPPVLGKLPQLKELYLSQNEMTSIGPEIGKLVNVEKMTLSNNKLPELPAEMGEMRNLKTVCVRNNKLRTFPPQLANLTRLTGFTHSDNEIEYIPPPFQRLLDRVNQRHGNQVYHDSQNVHNSDVQRSFLATLQKLFGTKPELNLEQTINEILDNPVLTEKSKKAIADFTSIKEVHSVANVSYGDLLTAVWDRVRKNPAKDEICKVMNSDLNDSICVCFTGRITRLVNALNGFDPDVVIQISSNEQLSNLVLKIRNQYKEVEDQKKALVEAMKERGFGQDEIDEWCAYLDE